MSILYIIIILGLMIYIKIEIVFDLFNVYKIHGDSYGEFFCGTEILISGLKKWTLSSFSSVISNVWKSFLNKITKRDNWWGVS